MRLRILLGVLACAAAAWAQTEVRRGAVIASAAPGSYLGIGVGEVTAERAKALNLKEERGAEVTSVKEDSPASKAGFKEGDVVLEYNGEPVQGTEQLIRMVRETPVGRVVKIVVWRGGANQTLTASIGQQKSGAAAIFSTPSGGTWVMPRGEMPEIVIPEMPKLSLTWQNPTLGIYGESIGKEQQLAEFFGVADGVFVRSVVKGSAAEKAGIKAGDVITKVDDAKVTSTDEITKMLRALRDSKSTFNVVVVRNKKETTLTVTMERSTGGMHPVRASTRVVNC